MAPTHFSRRFRLVATLALTAGVAVANVARHVGTATTPQLAALVPLQCPLKALFGVPCPTCGMGRALVAAATGRWGEAWTFHPLALPLFAGLVAVAIAAWLAPARTATFLRRVTSRRFGAAFVAVLLGVFALRLVTDSVPT